MGFSRAGVGFIPYRWGETVRPYKTMQKYPDVVLPELLDRLPYEAYRSQLVSAYNLANDLYEDRVNVAGLGRLQHILRVVDTLLDFNMDIDTLQAGVLYHATKETFDQVEKVCGRNVVIMLKALRHMDIYTENMNPSQRTLEAVRRAAFNIINGDVRVVLIRIIVALHSLRAAYDLPDDRKKLIAKDVRNIYAPLANRLGIWQVKWELEDLVFRYLEPEAYREIAMALDEKREERNRRILGAKAKLNQALKEYGIEADVTGRSKHIYSIHKKMVRKGVGLDKIFDAHALRIILEQDEPERPDLDDDARKKARYVDCYRALGLVHSLWKSITSEFDDYIQHPKSNGYKSLHTAVYDDDGKILEVQIRTRRMHELAEHGFAAHWAYKEAGGKPSAGLLRQIDTLRNLLDAMDTPDLSAPELPVADEPEQRVYVFTPGNDVIDLPKGATPVDFAYAVHTQVGHRCRGAKVNGRMVSLNTELQSGDHVEIITSSKDRPGNPNSDWMNESLGYTATSRARSRIRQWFRTNQQEKYIEIGRGIIDRELRELKVGDYVMANDLADWAGDTVADYLTKVGFGDIKVKSIQGTIGLIQHARREAQPKRPQPVDKLIPRPSSGSSGKAKGLTVMGMEGLATKFAKCCNPIYPEPIVGYITRGQGIAIHRSSCKQLSRLRQKDGERIVEEVSWGSTANGKYSVPFYLKAMPEPGILEKIATTLSGRNITLLQTKISDVSADERTIYLLAEVNSKDEADWIRKKLEALPAVYKVVARQ